MLILSLKVSFKRVAVAAAILTAAILAVIYIAILRPTFGRPIRGGTEEERQVFLNSYGWEVETAGSYVTEVQIPKDFDSVFLNYNQIQLAQGCDLWDYAGKRVKRYSYPVSIYPENSADIRATILVYEGKIIGGDISSMEAGGFSHGFRLKQEYSPV